jgi:hypothetical protein
VRKIRYSMISFLLTFQFSSDFNFLIFIMSPRLGVCREANGFMASIRINGKQVKSPVRSNIANAIKDRIILMGAKNGLPGYDMLLAQLVEEKSSKRRGKPRNGASPVTSPKRNKTTRRTATFDASDEKGLALLGAVNGGFMSKQSTVFHFSPFFCRSV